MLIKLFGFRYAIAKLFDIIELLHGCWSICACCPPLYDDISVDDVSGECVFVESPAFKLFPFDKAELPLEIWCCCCWVPVFELLEHGLPSFTSTGTATRLGELADWNENILINAIL